MNNSTWWLAETRWLPLNLGNLFLTLLGMSFRKPWIPSKFNGIHYLVEMDLGISLIDCILGEMNLDIFHKVEPHSPIISSDLQFVANLYPSTIQLISVLLLMTQSFSKDHANTKHWMGLPGMFFLNVVVLFTLTASETDLYFSGSFKYRVATSLQRTWI